MVLYRHIYLSPHPDDAVLSCGGSIHAQVTAGESVLVATLFSEGPAKPVPELRSPFVAELHRRWGLGHDPAAGRRAEDRRALALLGAAALHLPFADCIYRTGPDGAPLYPSRDAIFGLPHPTETEVAGLLDQLVRALATLPTSPQSRIYVPLGVGGHVDHHLARLAAEHWRPARTGFSYYEEYPYAETRGEVQTALGAEPWQAQLVPLTEADLAAKVAAIACYTSQLSSFFADRAEMAQRVRAYAAHLADGQGYAECLFLLS